MKGIFDRTLWQLYSTANSQVDNSEGGKSRVSRYFNTQPGPVAKNATGNAIMFYLTQCAASYLYGWGQFECYYKAILLLPYELSY